MLPEINRSHGKVVTPPVRTPASLHTLRRADVLTAGAAASIAFGGGSRQTRVASGGRSSAHQDDRNVVVAAAFVREVDQLLRSVLEGGVHHHFADLVVLHHVGQPIGAEHEYIARLGNHTHHIHRHFLRETYRAGDDVL